MLKPNQIQPINNRIFIKVVSEAVEYEGVLIAPSVLASREKSNLAEVIAVAMEYNGNINVGDRVIFNKNSGAVIPFDSFNNDAPEYRLIKEEDILSKVISDS